MNPKPDHDKADTYSHTPRSENSPGTRVVRERDALAPTRQWAIVSSEPLRRLEDIQRDPKTQNCGGCANEDHSRLHLTSRRAASPRSLTYLRPVKTGISKYTRKPTTTAVTTDPNKSNAGDMVLVASDDTAISTPTQIPPPTALLSRRLSTAHPQYRHPAARAGDFGRSPCRAANRSLPRPLPAPRLPPQSTSPHDGLRPTDALGRRLTTQTHLG